LPASSSTSSAFPRTLSRSSSRMFPSKRFHDGSLFETAAIFYVQAPRFARRPDRSYRCGLSPQGSRGFAIRAEHASLPPHASDLLTIRSQAIDGVRTYTPRDSQPCRLLPRNRDVSALIVCSFSGAMMERRNGAMPTPSSRDRSPKNMRLSLSVNGAAPIVASLSGPGYLSAHLNMSDRPKRLSTAKM